MDKNNRSIIFPIGYYYNEDPTGKKFEAGLLKSLKEQKEKEIRERNEYDEKMKKVVSDAFTKIEEGKKLAEKQKKEAAELKRIKDFVEEIKNYKYKTYYDLSITGNYLNIKSMYTLNPRGEIEIAYNYHGFNVDPNNYSMDGKYPHDFPEKKKGDKIMVSATDAQLYTYAYYLRTLSTPIYEFSDNLKNVKNKNEKYGKIICRMEVDVLATITHLRTNNKKAKYYVMCKVKILDNGINRYIASQNSEMTDMIGKIGYIWQTFGSETETTKEPALSHFSAEGGKVEFIADKRLKYYEKNIEGIDFKFSSDGSSRMSNNINRMKELDKHPLVRLLVKAAKKSGVIKLYVGHINYNSIGSGGSHGQGKAVDIWGLYGKDGTYCEYRRDYMLISKTPVLDANNEQSLDEYGDPVYDEKWEWNTKYQPDLIAKFEAAFMAESESLQILGSWNMYYKHWKTGEPLSPQSNYIYTYPQLGQLSRTYYVYKENESDKKKKKKDPNYVMRTEDQLKSEYNNVYYEETDFFKKLDIIIGDIKKAGDLTSALGGLNDDALKKTLHLAFQHHHHGHFAVK